MINAKDRWEEMLLEGDAGWEAMLMESDARSAVARLNVEAASADLERTYDEHMSIGEAHPLYFAGAWWAYAKGFKEARRDARTAVRTANKARCALEELHGQREQEHATIRKTVLAALCNVLALDWIAREFEIDPDNIDVEPLLATWHAGRCH